VGKIAGAFMLLDRAWTYNCNNVAEPAVSRRHDADAPSAAQLQKLLRVVGRHRQRSALERQPAHRAAALAASLPGAEHGTPSRGLRGLPCAEHVYKGEKGSTEGALEGASSFLRRQITLDATRFAVGRASICLSPASP